MEDRQVKQTCGDKVVCERWCVTKKDVVVCDKVVCERWCEREHVTKLSVKDGVCERWCMKDGVSQRWCVKEGV